jgi:hypothetical protein
MKFTLKKTPEVVEMFRLMISKNIAEASAARSAFAASIQGAIYNTIEAEALLGQFFSQETYDYGTPATIPLATLWDIRQNNFLRVWSQHVAGGLVTATNMASDELPVMTHDLTSAVAFKQEYVRANRVNVVAEYLQWLAQEFLFKMELDRANVMMTTAAQTQWIDNAGTTKYQVMRTAAQDTITPQDFNKAATMLTRIGRPNIGGTSRNGARSLSTLLVSPEVIEKIKNSAFQPLNTQAATTAIPSSDKFRDSIYDAAGNPSWYGTELVVSLDLGVGYPYNIIFGNAAGSNAYTGYGGTGTAAFSPGSEQVAIGLNRGIESFKVLSEISPESNSTLTVEADNQWSNRAKEIGFFLSKREGLISVDARSSVAIIL